MAAEAVIKYLEAEEKERQREAGGDHGNQYTGGKVAVVELVPQVANEPAPTETKSREKAGKMFNVSGRSVSDAKIITEKGTPEEVEAVKAGVIISAVLRRLTGLPIFAETAIFLRAPW